MTTKMTDFDHQQVTRDQVRRAYSGRQGCACGCRGQYFEGETAQATTILRQLQALDNVEVFPGLDGEIIIAADKGNRSLVVYLHPVTA